MAYRVEKPIRTPVHAVVSGKGHNLKANLDQRIGDARVAAHRVASLGQTRAPGGEIHLKLAETEVGPADAIPYVVEAGCRVRAILRHVADGDEVDAHLP
jgi:hypothetical protein